METIQVKDKKFGIFIPYARIQEVIDSMAVRLNRDLAEKNPLFVVVLNGAFVFAADIYRRLEFDSEISFVKLASYRGTQTTGVVRELIGLDNDLQGRTVVILEDIIDSGYTMAYALKKFREMGATEVLIAALLFKPDAFKENYKIDYLGMEIPNDFIVGFGLDYDGHGRHYRDIYKVK
ncbi:MAG: hypoxanthine phosphoribosyltransferase [Bacteroidetes bacterium]|nr:hypoxanthine phosphoribosyltransferase [Bacteroidota bacterium]